MENIKQVINYKRVFNLNHPTNFYELSWDKLDETREVIRVATDMLLEGCNKDKRDLTEAEYSACNQSDEYIRSIDKEKETRLINGTQEPLKPRVIDVGGRVSPNSELETANGGPGVGRSYRDLFHGGDAHRTLDKGNFQSFKEFCEILHGGKHDARMESRVHQEGIGSLGGHVVPEAYAETIWTPVLENSIVMSRAYVKPVLYGSSYYQPVLKNYSHVGGIFGVTPVWSAEAATGSNQDLTFGFVELSIYKLLLYMSASNELLSDGIGIEKQLTDAMRSALIWTVDTECLTGNGVAKPSGVLNAPSRITISRNTASDVKYSDICNMFSRLYPGCVNNAVWVVSVSALPKLVQMVDTGNHSIWVANASGPAPGSIFGRPVILTEKTPALGSEGDVMLVDFSQYCIAMRNEITLDKSNGPGFMADVMSYRAGVRMNGLPLWEEAIVPANGGNTLSWCVVLD